MIVDTKKVVAGDTFTVDYVFEDAKPGDKYNLKMSIENLDTNVVQHHDTRVEIIAPLEVGTK